MFNSDLKDMELNEAIVRLDEHDLYCETCRLVEIVANQARCSRGQALQKLVSQK